MLTDILQIAFNETIHLMFKAASQAQMTVIYFFLQYGISSTKNENSLQMRQFFITY